MLLEEESMNCLRFFKSSYDIYYTPQKKMTASLVACWASNQQIRAYEPVHVLFFGSECGVTARYELAMGILGD